MPCLININSNVKLFTINRIHLRYQKGGEIAGKFLDKVRGGRYSTGQMCLCLRGHVVDVSVVTKLGIAAV
jgi:hypothetical protein